MINNTRIIIADDMEPILLYLENVISQVPEFKVVGKTQNGEELVDLVASLKPDLVITDEEMPKLNGLQAIEKLNELHVKAKYIVITGNNCIMTSKARNMGVLRIIKKPIVDDKKFIEQIKQALVEQDKNEILKDRIEVALRPSNKSLQKECIIKKILNKIFKSK